MYESSLKMPGVLQEPPSPMEVTEEEPAKDKEPTKNEAPASRPVVGIIYPPPEVRSIPHLS